MTKSTFLTLAAGVAILTSVPAYAATSISGSMNLTAFSSIAGGTVLNKTDHASDSYVGATVPMGVFALATINDGVTGGMITVKGQAQSSGTANAGTVHFQDYGWSFNAPNRADAGQSANLNNHSGGPDWSYTFKADGNGTLSMTYDSFVVLDNGVVFGLQGWDIGWSGTGGGLLLASATNPTANGTFIRGIIAGQTYTLSLSNNTNINTGGNLSGGAAMSGNFNYTIAETAVPEAATWTLMIAGFLGVGVAMRRRQAMSLA